MSFDLFYYPGLAWAWIRENYVVLLVIIAAIGTAALLYWLYTRFGPRKEIRRDAVKRALKSRYAAARARGKTKQELWTRGNLDTERACWGQIVGRSDTAHALFLETRPRRGPAKLWRRKRVIVPRFLAPDTKTQQLEIYALGLGFHEGIWWPDDDLTDPEVREAWLDALSADGTPLEALEADLPGRVHQWYQRAIGLEVAAQEGVTMRDNMMYNIHLAMSSSIEESRQVYRDGQPELAERRHHAPPRDAQARREHEERVRR